MSESELIADQLRRAFYGEAWHGPGLFELLDDVDAAMAATRPIPDVHSIWELLLHVAVWDDAALVRLSGKKHQPTGPKELSTRQQGESGGLAQGRCADETHA